MTPAVSRRLWLAVAGLALLDWSLPFGFLNGLFFAHRWFPTNITRIFAGSLGSADTIWAILAVSASAPLFWSAAGLLTAALARTAAACRAGSPSRASLAALAAGQALFFAAAEFLLPWADARGFLTGAWVDAAFPPVIRGHGRAYAWLHLPSLALFALSLRRKTASSPS